MRRLLTTMAACVVLTTGPAAAASEITMKVTPPVGIDSARLTCGWHRSCRSPYQPWRGLDWGRSDDGYRVWLRVRAYTGSAAQVRVSQAYLYPRTNGDCHEVVAKVYDATRDRHLASLFWQHTWRGSTKWIAIEGSTDWPLNTHLAGSMIEEPSGCPWTGYHAHSYHTNAAETVVENGAIPDAPETRHYSNPKSLYERRLSWTGSVS